MKEDYKPAILIVDDSPANLLAMGRVLESLDATVIKARSGNEALSLMQRHDFAVVLLDVRMPDMGGFETATLMRDDDTTSHVPIIFVTAISETEEYVFKSYEAGTVDYLPKPVNPDILRSKAKLFLQLNRQNKALEVTDELKYGKETLQLELDKRSRLATDREEILYKLRERVKELTCIYGVAKSLREHDTLDTSLLDIVELLPPAWQYSRITRAKIILDGREYVSEPFEETDRKQTSDIVVGGERVGSVEVYYMERCHAAREGQFLKQERNLIDGVAHALSERIERKRAEEALRQSESRLREAQRMARLGHWTWDVKTNEVDWSEEVYKIFRLKSEEFTPQIDSILELSPRPEDHQRDKELIQKAIESHEQGSYEQRFLFPDGSTGYYFSTFQGIYDADGQLTAIKGTVQDITERKRAEEELRATTSFLDTVVDMSPFAMWIADPDGTVIRVNRSLCEILGLTDEQVVGTYNVLADENLQNKDLAPLVKSVFKKHKPVRFSMPWKVAEAGDVDFDGARDLYIDVSMFPILNAENELANVVCQWVDITERKRAEEEARILNAELEQRVKQRTDELEELHAQLLQSERMAALGTIGAGVAHELNNPMMGIINQIQYAKDNVPQEDRTHEVLEQALANARQCVRIVEDLLTYSRKTDAEWTGDSDQGDVNAAVKEALRDVENDLAEAGVELQLDLQSGITLAALEGTRLRQIVAHLAENARDAMAECPRRELLLRTREQGGYVTLAAQDSGPGMDEQSRSRVFEPFFTTKPPGSGTGLGLWLCNNIVQSAGGRIEVESTPGRGCTFTVLIPKVKKQFPSNMNSQEVSHGVKACASN